MPAKTTAKEKSAKTAKTAKTGASRGKKAGEGTKSALSREAHEKAAYFNWLDRGATHGDDQRDWFDVMKK